MKVNNSKPVRLAGLALFLPGVIILLQWLGWISPPKWVIASCYLLQGVAIFLMLYYQRLDKRRTGETG